MVSMMKGGLRTDVSAGQELQTSSINRSGLELSRFGLMAIELGCVGNPRSFGLNGENIRFSSNKDDGHEPYVQDDRVNRPLDRKIDDRFGASSSEVRPIDRDVDMITTSGRIRFVRPVPTAREIDAGGQNEVGLQHSAPVPSGGRLIIRRSEPSDN